MIVPDKYKELTVVLLSQDGIVVNEPESNVCSWCNTRQCQHMYRSYNPSHYGEYKADRLCCQCWQLFLSAPEYYESGIGYTGITTTGGTN